MEPIVPEAQPIGNVNAGIELEDNDHGTGNCLIGNLISGNGTGIHIGQLSLPGAILNTVQANYIGTDVSGTKAIPNERFGIIVTDSRNTIGWPRSIASKCDFWQRWRRYSPLWYGKGDR